jgi:DNA-binding HxlR family transcriptional regulator
MTVMAGRGRIRYTDLRAELPGISNALFSQRLKTLVATGLLVRHVTEGPPVLTSYETTPAGRELADHAVAMARLLHEHAPSA